MSGTKKFEYSSFSSREIDKDGKTYTTTSKKAVLGDKTVKFINEKKIEENVPGTKKIDLMVELEKAQDAFLGPNSISLEALKIYQHVNVAGDSSSDTTDLG